MIAYYQDQLKEIQKKRLANPLLPGIYKWSNKDDAQELQQIRKTSSILIETETLSLPFVLTGVKIVKGFLGSMIGVTVADPSTGVC